MVVAGTCSLCCQKAELQRSHLMPRAIYLDLRMPELPNPNPIFGTPEETAPRQEQIVASFLCGGCEHRLNVNGEKWVMEHGYRLKGPSRLYQILKNAEPLPEHSGGTVYAGAELKDLDMDQLAYFGASIFWRASQPVWSIKGKRWHFLDLGRYAEQLRLFLTGEREFPTDMVLWSAVCRTPEPPPVISFPTGEVVHENGQSFHRHTFDIPGLSYMLFVGRRVPKRVRDFCMIRSSRRLLFFSNIERIIERNTGQVFRKSPVSPSLRKLHSKVTGEEL